MPTPVLRHVTVLYSNGISYALAYNSPFPLSAVALVQVVSAYTALPFPFRAGSKLVDCFAELPALHSDSLSMSMTPLTHDDVCIQ